MKPTRFIFPIYTYVQQRALIKHEPLLPILCSDNSSCAITIGCNMDVFVYVVRLRFWSDRLLLYAINYVGHVSSQTKHYIIGHVCLAQALFQYHMYRPWLCRFTYIYYTCIISYVCVLQCHIDCVPRMVAW